MHDTVLPLMLVLFAVLPAAARADTIDDFRLTGEGNVVTFSLPASPNAFVSTGAGGVIAGFYVVGGATVVINGTSSVTSVEFLSGQLGYIGPGLIIPNPPGMLAIEGALLYDGTAANPTFKTGSFAMKDFFGDNLPYTLTITPETATPEPGGMILVATGVAAVACCRRRSDWLQGS